MRYRMTLSSFAMLLFIILLSQLFSVSRSDNSIKCVNDTYIGTSVKPSADRIEGRYDVEWCTIKNVNATEWQLLLSYNLSKKEKDCTKPKLIVAPQKHSEFSQLFAPEDVNCTHVCFTTTLDMLYSGCFRLENWLPAMGSQRNLFVKYITNNYTSESFEHNNINADTFIHDDYVAVHWHLGNVVASTYDMTLCSENLTAPDEERKLYGCRLINNNCTLTKSNPHEIICKLHSLSGSYYMTLKHNAPWTVGRAFIEQVFSHYSFEVGQTTPLELEREDWAGLWAGAGVLAVCLFACVSLCVWRRRGDTRLRQTILHAWQKRKPGIEPVIVESSPRSVLLLYAREGDVGEPLIQALGDLLRAAGMKVWDLYSPDTVSVSAAAPASWVRTALSRQDILVLVLQTPSLAALYGDRAVPLDGGAESAFLRKPRVVPAEPAPGDALLSLALRLLEEDVTTTAPYNKYFLATLDSLETETLPTIVPFRRYALPRDVTTLLRDLLPSLQHTTTTTTTPLQSEQQRVQHACHAFVQHVQACPGYLADHLLILD